MDSVKGVKSRFHLYPEKFTFYNHHVAFSPLIFSELLISRVYILSDILTGLTYFCIFNQSDFFYSQFAI